MPTPEYRRFGSKISASPPALNTEPHSPHSSIQGLTLCIQERRRFVAALDKRDADRARRRLVRNYLPALRDMVALIDPERIEAELNTISERLNRGLDYAGPEKDAADDLFEELLHEYEVIWDCWSLQFEGLSTHPANYFADRIVACQR